MTKPYSFRFLDPDRNELFLSRLARTPAKYIVDDEGTVYFIETATETAIEKATKAIRDRFTAPWQIVTCPQESLDAYRAYMTARDVPFIEEEIDGEIAFTLSQKYRPHTWRLDESRPKAKPRRKLAAPTL